jgi:hypothetical protein
MDFDPFYLSLKAIENARAKRIELLPMPRYSGPDALPHEPGCVMRSTPRGHYFALQEDMAQITIVDDHRPAAETYSDLIPGYEVELIEVIPSIGDDGKEIVEERGRFSRVLYKPVKI